MNRDAVFTETLEAGPFKAKIEVLYDEDCCNPNDWGGPQVFNADRGDSLRKEARSTFGCYGGERDYDDDEGWQLACSLLAEGEVVSHGGTFYVGFEEYRHSGSAFALCAKRGNFPDRRWDVIGLAGWIAIDQSEVSAKEEPEREQEILKRAGYALADWEAYVNGQCFGYQVEVTCTEAAGDWAPGLVNEDSCWGFLGDSEYCLEEARNRAKDMLEEVKR